MPCFSLKTFILAEAQPQIKNKTSHSELVYIWQSKGKPTPLIHFYRKVQSSTEQYYNLMSLCGLAMTLMVSHLHHLEKVNLLQCPGIGLRPRQLQDANKNVPCLADSPQFARWWLSPFLLEEGSALLVGRWESRNTSHTAQQSKRTHWKATGDCI